MATKGEITKERLLTEATRIIQKKGFTATSVSDLLTAAGVKKGSLYFHFPGKDELGMAVLERSQEKFEDFFDRALSGNSPSERLSHFFDEVVDYHRKTNFIGGCIFGNTALEMSDRDERYAGFVDRFFHQMAGTLEKVVTEGQEAGQIRSDLPANTLAHQIIVTLEGGIMLARLRKDKQPLRSCFETLKVLLELKQ